MSPSTHLPIETITQEKISAAIPSWLYADIHRDYERPRGTLTFQFQKKDTHIFRLWLRDMLDITAPKEPNHG